MPLVHNGVAFHEACLESPEFGIVPERESRLRMTGWFRWDDMVGDAAAGVASPAGKAFVGWCQVATGYPGADPALPYLNFTLPYVHADFPNQMFLCEGFERVRGFVPTLPAVSPRGTAQFEEAHTVLSLVSAPHGYRVLPDSAVVDPAFGVPREYYLLRNFEVIERTTTRHHHVPGFSGFEWQYSLAPGAALPGVIDIGVAALLVPYVAHDIPMKLDSGEITLHWHTLPVSGAFNLPAFLELVGKALPG